MARLLFCVLACAGFLICPGTLSAQWEEIPSYEWREALQLDSFQNRVFLLEDRGILYRSDNHGLRWKALQPGGSTTDAVEAFAGTGDVFLVYCASGNIWRSEDLGDSWSLLIKTTPPLLNNTSSLVTAGGRFFLSNSSAAYELDPVSGQKSLILSIPSANIQLTVEGTDIWAIGFPGAPRRSADLGQTWNSYSYLQPIDLAFQGDTVWVLQYVNNAHRIVYFLKSDPAQQLNEIPLPTDAVSDGWNKLSVAGGQLYYSYLSKTSVYAPLSQSWQNTIPYWKNERVGKIWSDGSFVFALTTEGPLRQDPVTGSWDLCNTGMLHLPIDPPQFKSTGPYLFMDDDWDLGGKGGLLRPGPSPVWLTPHRFFAASIGQTDSGYYAWDDSSRFWRADANLREWTLVGKGPADWPKLYYNFYYGRVFGKGDTLYTPTNTNYRLLRSVDGGVNWELAYAGIPNESGWEEILFTRGNEAMFIDEYKIFNYLNTKYQQGLWSKRGTLSGYGRGLDVLNNTLYASTPSKSISISGDQGYTWSVWPLVDKAGFNLSYADMEVCEAGVFVICSTTAPPGQVYPGLFYAPEAGDTFVRISFPPFDTLPLHAETNKLTSIKYVDGYLYIGMSKGQIYRQAFGPQQVYAYSGDIWLDENDNGLREPDEKPLPNIVVRRGKFHFGVSNAQGRYTILDDLDPDTIRVAAPWKNWKITPRIYPLTTPADSFDFAYRTPNYRDFSIEQTLFPVLKPGKPSFVQLHWDNKSKPNDATIRWAPPLDHVSIIEYQTPPDAFLGDTAIWHLPTQPVYGQGDIYIAIETHTDEPAGAPVFFWAEISPITPDDAPEDNVDTATTVVYASFDPNDKAVEPAVYTTEDLARGRPLHYTVRFQNTGNYPAALVYIRDTIDPGLDLNTMQVLSASHPYTWRFIGDRVVEFLFDPIELPDSVSNEPASHGFIKYALRPDSLLEQGDRLRNTAYIYFDFNAPVQTNTVETVIAPPPPVSTHSAPMATLRLSPNPSSGRLWVSAPAPVREFRVYSVLGELVQCIELPAGTDTRWRLDLSALPAGVYVLQAALPEGGMAVGKVVKE
ncbi:MAG: hypothetical protein IT260_24185 [Saprospiraceae bacterium]|nr:hypothetical protein [Saprospiraceae bacterium]